jgi:hypothetical protein
MCLSIVKTALVVQDILGNPGSSRTADYQEHIVLQRRILVPKMAERTGKSRIWRIETGNLVQKDNASSLAFRFGNQICQG